MILIILPLIIVLVTIIWMVLPFVLSLKLMNRKLLLLLDKVVICLGIRLQVLVLTTLSLLDLVLSGEKLVKFGLFFSFGLSGGSYRNWLFGDKWLGILLKRLEWLSCQAQIRLNILNLELLVIIVHGTLSLRG